MDTSSGIDLPGRCGNVSGGQKNGWTLELGASVGPGNANGKDESWTNTNVTAGNVLAIQSGGDTTLKGASGKADQIIASVGGNLLLESLQDSSKYDSKNKRAGFGLALCIPPYCAGSINVSANASTGKMNSNFKAVTEQTGLWAGDGGFLIDVKNNTTLIGSVIASSDTAVADGLNKLTTGTLLTEDLKNTARYSGSQVLVSIGMGSGLAALKRAIQAWAQPRAARSPAVLAKMRERPFRPAVAALEWARRSWSQPAAIAVQRRKAASAAARSSFR